MRENSRINHFQRLLVLICYSALLIPRASGVILCINPCGIASVETSAHQCHGGEHDHESHHAEHASEIRTPDFLPGLHHSHNCCTDVPLGTETPQLVGPVLVIPPLARSLSDGTVATNPTPSLHLFERTAEPPPSVAGTETTILQL